MSLDAVLETLLDRIEERVRRVLREERAGIATDLLTYAEAGEFVRRQPRTIARWVSAGTLPSAGRGLVRRADVLARVESDGKPDDLTAERVARVLGRVA